MFTPGDKIQIFNGQIWHNAILIKHNPYYHKTGIFDGFDYRYDPLPQTDPITGITPSMGGWITVKNIRNR